MPSSAPIPQWPSSPSQTPDSSAAEDQKGSSEGMLQHQIVTPLPGVFYRNPGPGKPPYVAEGDRVEVGQPIGLVEIMKQFSEVKSTASGIVDGFMVDDCSDVCAGTVIAVVRSDP